MAVATNCYLDIHFSLYSSRPYQCLVPEHRAAGKTRYSFCIDMFIQTQEICLYLKIPLCPQKDDVGWTENLTPRPLIGTTLSKLPYLSFSRCRLKLYDHLNCRTVEPWYKDHLWERAKVVFIARWSLYQGDQIARPLLCGTDWVCKL